MTFLMKTTETKTFVKIFCEAFLIKKKKFLQPSRTYFHFYKKGALNSPAVRIRVKLNFSLQLVIFIHLLYNAITVFPFYPLAIESGQSVI
jgi:hypothetical protein